MTAEASAVPRKTKRKSGVMIFTLIACMAAMPCAGGRLASALIMKTENVKKRPVITALPSVAKKHVTKSQPAITRES
jgi:hypothetical protein